MEFAVAAILILASFAGTGLIVLAIRQGQRRREAIQALARENGWHFDYQPSSGGRGSRLTISDPDEGWELVQLRSAGGSESSSVRRWTQFDQPDLALTDGMALLGPEIPAKTAAMAQTMLASTGGGGSIGRMLLHKMTGGLGDEAAELRLVPGPGAGTLFATPGRETALDAVRAAPELAEARRGRNEAMQPVVSRSRTGLRIRQNGHPKRASEVNALIELGRSLSQRLRES